MAAIVGVYKMLDRVIRVVWRLHPLLHRRRCWYHLHSRSCYRTYGAWTSLHHAPMTWITYGTSVRRRIPDPETIPCGLGAGGVRSSLQYSVKLACQLYIGMVYVRNHLTFGLRLRAGRTAKEPENRLVRRGFYYILDLSIQSTVNQTRTSGTQQVNPGRIPCRVANTDGDTAHLHTITFKVHPSRVVPEARALACCFGGGLPTDMSLRTEYDASASPGGLL